MVRVRFNTTILDRDSGETHYPSDEFVEISEAFAKRIREIQSEDIRHKDSFEWFVEPEKGKDEEFVVTDEFIKDNELEGIVNVGEVIYYNVDDLVQSKPKDKPKSKEVKAKK